MLIAKKINYFCTQAEAHDPITINSFNVSKSVSNYKNKHGGLWIGGECQVYTDRIQIRANDFNKRLHTKLGEYDIPIKAIKDIKLHKAFVTNILEIFFTDTSIKIRCFKAEKFRKEIIDVINSPNIT